MSRYRFFPPVIGLALALVAVAAAAGDPPALEFEKYTLANGLEVILHQDRTTPTVAVNIWYHVGSKNEKPGRTGFAHLFEHMMFQGSEHHDVDYFLPLQKVGGQVNGSTNKDRTNYWENVPADQLDLALWLEADRMGRLLPAMTQEKLDNQRDVVKNEKREAENQPYAMSDQLLLDLLFPSEHPYSWTVIGSMEDLGAASHQDVSDFFRTYYTPNNASLCVAGDFEIDQAKELISRYFGPIPPGPAVQRLSAWIPALDGERRAVAEDAVELPRLYMSWHTPGWYMPGDAEFDLLAGILAQGKNSRLHRSLVYEQQIAQDVRVSQASRELGGTFTITVTAAPGHSLAEVESAVDGELDLILEKGVNKRELKLAVTRYEADFVRGLQRIGGFGGKADRLNRYNVYTGGPGYLNQDLARYRAANTAKVTGYARKYLGFDNRAVLHIVPQRGLAAASSETSPVDPGARPGSMGPVRFEPPAIQTVSLENGLKICLVEKHDLPLVEVHLVLKSGWSTDPSGKHGVAAMAADLLDEGTRDLDALEIANAAESLGARLGTRSYFDGSTVTLNLLKDHFLPGLELMSKVAREPAFPEAEFQRIKKNYLGRQQQEAARPVNQGIKELQLRVFGATHPYAQPYTGSGTVESLSRLAVADLATFHQQWYRPNNATVVIVGDLTLDEATAAVNRSFGDWTPHDLPVVEVPEIQPQAGAAIVVIDKPGAQQSYVVGGYAGPARGHPEFEVYRVLNTAFGAEFSSRINLNLREDKGYTYGVRSRLLGFRSGGLFMITAPVHTRHTADAIQELIREMTEVRGPRPVVGTELEDARNRLVMGFPQQFETIEAMAGSLDRLLRNELSLDTWQTYGNMIAEISAEEVNRVVAELLDPARLTWVIVGDWAVIADSIRALGLGEIEVLVPDRS